MEDAQPPVSAAPHTAEPAVPRDSAFLRQFLAGRDVPCPMYEYNLRDLEGDRCLECGDTLVLRVNAAEPRQADLIAGIVCLAGSAGFSGLLLSFALLVDRAPNDFLLVVFLGLVVEGAALVAWVKSWRSVRKMPNWRCWLIVAGCAALTLANLLAFIKRVR
jgi:hypothetical protein